MTREQLKRLDDLLGAFIVDKPIKSVSDWCAENVRFNEPNNSGPFTLSGREYIREPLDAWSDPRISDMVSVFGSQSGKTAKIMAGVAWTIANNPSRIFWVMPTRDTVIAFARDRLLPMMKSTPELSAMIPVGKDRHKFNNRSQTLGGSIASLVWSNSAASLAGVPAPIVILDEVDKFNEGTRRETNAVNLAEQRTKGFANPKRFKSSTPTLVSGLIWQEFLKTDQRRRFMPCPMCSKLVVLAWSRAYTVFKPSGCEAFIEWDAEAKREDGSWDLDRVHRSTRARCPHCAGHINDASKTKMDRGGVWQPTAVAAKGYRGWHLSSLYTAAPETAWGKLAVKFLQAKKSIQGLQGFINGDLAEPYQAQDTMRERVETITEGLEVGAEWRKILTVDCQAKAPYFWHVVRAWNGGNSEGVEFGPLDTWEDIRARQLACGVDDRMVAIDSGFGARSEAEVYRNCARFGEAFDNPNGRLIHLGWMPSKGMPSRRRWKDPESNLMTPYYLRQIDPFTGTSRAGDMEMSLFEFAADYFKDILQNLRDGKAGFTWKVGKEMATEMYWRHMDGQHKQSIRSSRTGLITETWVGRNRHWPDHGFDCENLQVAMADFFKMFEIKKT